MLRTAQEPQLRRGYAVRERRRDQRASAAVFDPNCCHDLARTLHEVCHAPAQSAPWPAKFQYHRDLKVSISLALSLSCASLVSMVIDVPVSEGRIHHLDLICSTSNYPDSALISSIYDRSDSYSTNGRAILEALHLIVQEVDCETGNARLRIVARFASCR